MNKRMLAGVAVAGAVAASTLAASASATEPQATSGKRLPAASDLLAGLPNGEVRAQAPMVTEVGTATIRLHGLHRFDTAASVSRSFYDYENTIVVSLVNGRNFPDALSLGPALSPLGPTLLVERDSLPAATRDELQRLRPCWIVSAGGVEMVSDAVLREADRYTDPASCGAF